MTSPIGTPSHRLAGAAVPESVVALLDTLIDYAGLFPPAGLGMVETVRNYAAYQRGPDAWALARLVVPVARLQEFEAALAALPEAERLGARFPITALLGSDPMADLGAVCTFNERHEHGGPAILSLEARAGSGEQIARLRAVVPEEYDLFCELPLAGDLTTLVCQVRAAGASAKVRTGGLNPAEIPAPEAVLAFLSACATEGVPFKATAGLHHALRGDQPLSYAADAPRGTMHGYCNLLLAATVLWHERPTEEALALLSLTRDQPMLATDERIVWGGIAVSREEISMARAEFAQAIGACSFTEPLEEAPRA
ncbi:MAG: hypothetical protein SF070_18835 [Gemmatimonadota bacterium]|nr:hypothetical protein [Gemmatimonadota bacterium]